MPPAQEAKRGRPGQMDPVLEVAEQLDSESIRKATQLGGTIEPVKQGNSFTLWWQPEGFDPTRDITLVSLHGSGGWATKDFTIWQPILKQRGYAFLGVQWWYGRSTESIGYAKPNDIYPWIVEALEAHGVPPGRVIFTGFSMGGANSFAVAFLDHQQSSPYFAVTIANAGAMEADFPPNDPILNGPDGATPLTDTHWILYCSLHDEARPQACGKMTWTDEQLKRLGGSVELFLKDAKGGHGGFMQPAMHNQALDLAEQLVSETAEP